MLLLRKPTAMQGDAQDWEMLDFGNGQKTLGSAMLKKK